MEKILRLIRIYWASNPNLSIHITHKEEVYPACTIADMIGPNGAKVLDSDFTLRHLLISSPEFTIKPYLKPLSSITDEDMVEMARLAGLYEPLPVIFRSKAQSLFISVGNALGDKLIIDGDWNIYFMRWRGEDKMHPANTAPAIDYLRSKSYNLDFKEGEYIPV